VIRFAVDLTMYSVRHDHSITYETSKMFSVGLMIFRGAGKIHKISSIKTFFY